MRFLNNCNLGHLPIGWGKWHSYNDIKNMMIICNPTCGSSFRALPVIRLYIARGVSGTEFADYNIFDLCFGLFYRFVH